ncbi:MAG TPA: oligosaccharide flippase family protein, partial [Chitinophagaceae bacterium]|nr:oligosaccharide flippase family protein [Chitinophagaceae bacterium]
MSGIKQLAGQTLWYGVSSIAARFLNYLLTPYLTLQLSGADYGEMSAVYAAIPLFNILFTYGLETAYFRFASDAQRAVAVYSTATLSLIGSTVVLTALLLLLRGPMAGAIGLESHPEYFTLAAGIIALDALSALSFAKLRLDGRPVKYALIRVGAILVNIGLTFFFLSVCPRLQESDPHSFIGTFYRKEDAVKYILLANLVQ